MLQSRLDQDLYCPACAVTTRHKLLFAKNGCDILRCGACGLGRADAAGFDPARYYTADYFSGTLADGYADYLATAPVLRAQFRREVAFVRRFRPSGRLVEIGCAYGFFLNEARASFDVAGIELAEDAAAHCRREGLDVLTGVADNHNLDRLGPADVFVLLDVIEHLPDPFDTLERCAKRLKPNGVIALTTGDFGSPLARLAGAHWRLMTPPQHLWYLTLASVQTWALRSGMRLEAHDHPAKIVPLSLIVFQLGRMLGRQSSTVPGTRVGIPVNLFDAVRIVLRRAPAP
jgi:SAM-dependent methyltransferase